MFFPEIPAYLAGDVDVEDDNQTEKPPEVPEPDYPRNIEQSPENELCPLVADKLLQTHFKLTILQSW